MRTQNQRDALKPRDPPAPVNTQADPEAAEPEHVDANGDVYYREHSDTPDRKHTVILLRWKRPRECGRNAIRRKRRQTVA